MNSGERNVDVDLLFFITPLLHCCSELPQKRLYEQSLS